jgi:hypothetical protein
MGFYEVIAYLWLNAIGCFLVIIIAALINPLINESADNQAKISA